MSNPQLSPLSPIRLSALDGLRGYAALIVVFFHSILEIKPVLIDQVLKKPIYALTSSDDLWIKIFLILFNGHAAVSLFFVLSGAVLMRCLLQARDTSTLKLLTKFIVQRILRIYPALIACLIAIYVLSNNLNSELPAIFHDHFSMLQFWNNAFLFKTPLHGASWTLQAEMVAVPLICLAYCLVTRRKYVLLFLIYSLIFALYQPIGLLCFILGFIIGSSQNSGVMIKNMNTITWIFLLVLTLSLKHFFPADKGLLMKGCQWCFQGIAVFGLVGYVYYKREGIIITCLNHPISQFLGRISYSLYLFNVVGLHALIACMHYFFPNLCAQLPLVFGLCVGILLSLMTLPIAYLSYKYIEKPGIRLGKWLFERQQLSAPSAISVQKMD